MDMFALGILAFEVMTGKRFYGEGERWERGGGGWRAPRGARTHARMPVPALGPPWRTAACQA